MFDFSGQVALVTGASRGIGQKVAEELACHGATVVIASRSQAATETSAKLLQDKGLQAVPTSMDVRQEDQVKSVVRRLLDQLGKIDILVNNAGISHDNLLLRMRPGEWKKVLSTNLDGVFHVTREVLPSMVRRRYGRIINMTSVVGQMGNAGQSNYATSKAGLIGFTKALAREVASRKITVNAVSPGFIETSMTSRLDQETRRKLEKQIPLQRIGSTQDVAWGTCFLATKEAGYITGHVLNINGGIYM